MTSGRQLKPQPPTFLLGGNGGMAGNEAHLHSPRRAVRCASFSSPSSTTKPLVRNVCWTASRRLLYGRRAPRCQWRGGGLKTALHVGPRRTRVCSGVESKRVDTPTAPSIRSPTVLPPTLVADASRGCGHVSRTPAHVPCDPGAYPGAYPARIPARTRRVSRHLRIPRILRRATSVNSQARPISPHRSTLANAPLPTAPACGVRSTTPPLPASTRPVGCRGSER